MTEAPQTTEAELRLLEDFVNTRRPPTAREDPGRDALATADAAHAWLVGRGLLPEAAPELSGPNWRRLVALREALRSLLAANNGAPLSEDAVAAWNDAAHRARVAPQLGGDGRVRLEPAR